MFRRAKGTRRAEPPTEQDLREWLTSYLAGKLSVPPDELDGGRDFEDYGLDSRVGIQMTGKLEKFVERRLSPAILYDYQSIDALAAHLARQLREPGPEPREELA
jgi:acyl carrier protein